MSLKEQLTADLKTAMKAGDKARLEVVRLLKSRIGEIENNKMRDLTEDEYLSVLTTAIKQRKEAIELYQKGGRVDLVEKETAEIKVVESYMPQPLSTEELTQIVANVIQQTGATSIKELGNVMKAVMAQAKGRADGKLINQLVRDKLQG